MGSFANSLHVRATDAGRVAATLRQLLTEAGYVATDKAPKLGPFSATNGSQRGLVVCEARQGWVGVLDSDLAGLLTLGEELSRRLDTYAIQFLVNDSDAWIYGLYQSGRQLDEFDSSEALGGDDGFDDDEFDGGEFDEEGEAASGGAMISAADWSAIQPQLHQRMFEEQQRMMAEMPDDIRAIQQKLQRGVASSEETRNYSEWASIQSAKVMERIKELMPPGLMPGQPPTGSRRSKPRAGAGGEFEPQLARLRPILAAGVTDEQVLEIFSREAVFAEDTLREFLPLVGISPLFADLSYGYLSGIREPELAAGDIKIAERLNYDAAAALSR